ncbi:MAG: SEC-C domain-containing protein [candidate division NC10 bacterium]|nr:SEC-C domain-containing protein [candidate division NC10 bacterium]
MASNVADEFPSFHAPYWTVGDYVRFADHPSADVRLWALERLEELGLEIPDETLRRRLDDPEESVALLAAVLAGRLEVASLADALLARLERAEDAAGAACAESLARLGDPRILDLIRRRNHLPVEDRNPRVWLALSILTGPEAAGILREAFERFPSHGRGDIASILARSLMVADPGPGISLVVERWAREAKDTLADPLLHGLLLLCGFPEGAEALRDALEHDQEPPDVSLPEEVLDDLADLLPFGPVRDIRKSCRKGKWGRAMEGLLALAAPLASRAPDSSEAALSLLLIGALAERGEAIHRVEEKLRDAVGLLLLALDQIAGAVRMPGLTLPETLDGQLRWLLSDAALPHLEAQAAVVDRLVAAAPTESWKRLCVETLERRAAQAPMAASLLGAWRSEGATPSLVGALGAGEDPELPAAAEEALVNVGEPAMDAVLQALASAEDPRVLEGCLDVRVRLPSRRAVAAIGRRFEDLFILVPEALLHSVDRIGARDFVEPLRAEVREGERQAEDTFVFLCDLHGVADPRLSAIRQRQRREASRAAESGQDLSLVPEEHIDLALQCNGCRRTYTYPVQAVYVDPDPPKDDRIEPFIKDRIRCKGCGREDDYAVTPTAQLALMARLLMLTARMEKEGPEAATEGPLFLMRLGLTDGRRLNPREARRDYEARLATHPDDPALHIGYGNILRFLEETERAEAAYRRALVLEPQAIEAHASLGQLAEARGDLAAAESNYRQGLALGRSARYYQVKDRRAFTQTLEEALEGVQGARAARLPDPIPARAQLEAIVAEDLGVAKVGRNDPCPCGSGRKYKKCCLLKQSPAPVVSRPSGPESRLRERLDSFIERSLPRTEIHRAMREYFGERMDLDERTLEFHPETVDAEWPAFLDWLLYDFRLSGGQTPLAKFLADRGHSLPADERAILEEWQDSVIGLLEVADLDPGKSLTLRDVFTGETFQVREVRGSLSAARWDLLSNRVIRVQGERQLAGAGILFRPSDREGLVQHVTARYDAFRREHPDASWRDFFRAQPLIFRGYAEQLARDFSPPALHTAEGHPVVLGRLRYAVRDHGRLLAALSAAPDFEDTTQPDDPAGTRQFAWLRTGPAERYVTEAPRPEDGMTLTSQRIEGSGKPGPSGLASLTLTRDQLTVEGLSAQRLAWAKARLGELAGDTLSLRADIVEDVWRKVEASARSGRLEKPPSEIPPEVQTRLLGQTLHRHFKAWLDEGIQTLEGRTPRAAAQDLSLRPKVVQLLREIENHQDRARQQGQPW